MLPQLELTIPVLLDFLGRYLALYQDFLRLENEKLRDITEGKLQSLDAHVKAEEAMLLKSRGMDIERDKLMAQAGMENSTFRQLIDALDKTDRLQAQAIYDELARVLLDLREVNTRCNNLIEVRLRRVQLELEKLENNPQLRAENALLRSVYTSKAQTPNSAKPSGLFSAKI